MNRYNITQKEIISTENLPADKKLSISFILNNLDIVNNNNIDKKPIGSKRRAFPRKMAKDLPSFFEYLS